MQTDKFKTVKKPVQQKFKNSNKPTKKKLPYISEHSAIEEESQ